MWRVWRVWRVAHDFQTGFKQTSDMIRISVQSVKGVQPLRKHVLQIFTLYQNYCAQCDMQLGIFWHWQTAVIHLIYLTFFKPKPLHSHVKLCVYRYSMCARCTELIQKPCSKFLAQISCSDISRNVTWQQSPKWMVKTQYDQNLTKTKMDSKTTTPKTKYLQTKNILVLKIKTKLQRLTWTLNNKF